MGEIRADKTANRCSSISEALQQLDEATLRLKKLLPNDPHILKHVTAIDDAINTIKTKVQTAAITRSDARGDETEAGTRRGGEFSDISIEGGSSFRIGNDYTGLAPEQTRAITGFTNISCSGVRKVWIGNTINCLPNRGKPRY